LELLSPSADLMARRQGSGLRMRSLKHPRSLLESMCNSFKHTLELCNIGLSQNQSCIATEWPFPRNKWVAGLLRYSLLCFQNYCTIVLQLRLFVNIDTRVDGTRKSRCLCSVLTTSPLTEERTCANWRMTQGRSFAILMWLSLRKTQEAIIFVTCLSNKYFANLSCKGSSNPIKSWLR